MIGRLRTGRHDTTSNLHWTSLRKAQMKAVAMAGNKKQKEAMAKAREHRRKEREKRMPKTPAAQTGSDAVYPDDEVDEEQVNEGAMAPSSDGVEANAGTNDMTLHLGGELPDVLPGSRSIESDDAPEEVEMGAGQPDEEYSRNMRQASQQLQQESISASAAASSTSTSKRKSGKLVAPSSRSAVARKPVIGTQKRLGARNTIRKSAYDEYGLSPEKPSLRPNRHADPAQFSPLRDQKKAQQAVEPSEPSPRRSMRVQSQKIADDLDTAAGANTLPSDHALHRDWFPDAGVDRVREAQEELLSLSADLGDTFEEDAEQVAASASKASGSRSGAKAQERKAGRPRKGTRLSNAEEAVGEGTKRSTAITPSPTKQQNRQTTPRSSTKSSARAVRMRTELAAQHSQTDAQVRSAQSRHTPDDQAEIRPADSKQPDGAAGLEARPPRRRSSRIQQGLNDLNRRRNTQEPITARNERDDKDDDDQDKNDGRVEVESAAGKDHRVRPVTVRPSTIVFPDEASGDAVDASSVANGSTEQEPAKRGKRKASSQTAKANTAKRIRRAPPEESEIDVEDEPEDVEERRAAKRDRLWAQWLPLRKIYRDLSHIGCNYEDGERRLQNQIALRDEDVKALVKLCTEAKRRYKRRMEGNTDDDSEPASVLQEISLRIEGLRGHNDDYPTAFHEKTKTTDIYFHLMPALVRLMWRAVACYRALDKDEVPTGQISMSHLQIVQNIIGLTIDMENAAAKLYKARPDTTYAVVKPVHNEIAVPLLEVRKAFSNILHRHHVEVQAAERRQQEAQDRALQLEQEERRSRQEAELNRVRQKWEALHRERIHVEGGFIRPLKMAHLRMPDPDRDEDFDGNPFDRIQVFRPRVGPPPGLVDRAAELIWTEGELRALEDGLINYSGRMVYERLFREWCGRNKMLNKYNVTEIVTVAAMMKDMHMKQAEDRGEEPPEWVKSIPVWTKGHAMGKENEDEAAEDGQETAEPDAVVAGPS